MKNSILILSLLALTGCAFLSDVPKNIIGVSTREFEAARATASVGDFEADYVGLFNAILDQAKESKYYVFSQDEIRGLIVVMSIPGMVNTTEVGVFISSQKPGVVRVEIASRSTPAQRVVAEAIFNKIGGIFRRI